MRARKRFYKLATVTGSGPFGIALDGGAVRTPHKHLLALESRSLAEAVAEEWQAQESRINLSTMKFTSLAFIAIDHVAAAREQTVREIVQYAGSDLVCYRASEPAALVERQARHWNPVLDAVHDTLGVEFIVLKGITHRQQPGKPLQAATAYLQTRSAMQLSAIRDLTLQAGSALIALAVAEGKLDAAAAWVAAHVDEDWQIEHWGQDREAGERREAYRRQFFSAVEFLRIVSCH